MDRREYSVLHSRVGWPRPRRYVFQTLPAAEDFIDELRADENAGPLELAAVQVRRVGPWEPLPRSHLARCR